MALSEPTEIQWRPYRPKRRGLARAVLIGITLAAIATGARAGPSAAEDPRLSILQTSEYKYLTSMPRLERGQVVFTRFAEDGNNKDIVAVDPLDGSSEVLIAAARNEPRLVALDHRYLIYTLDRVTPRPVIVKARATGERLGSVRLNDGVVSGQIIGDRLLLTQEPRQVEGRFHTPALVYSLPDLKLQHSSAIVPGRLTGVWKDNLVIVANRLAIYDLELDPVAMVDLPEPYPELHFNCDPHSLRIVGDLAIVGPECGQIAVYDLAAARLLRVIRGFGLMHSFDVIDDLLFAVDTNRSSLPGLRVYELASGRELARLDTDAQFVAASEGRLLGMALARFGEAVHATVYEPNLTAIRSERARVRRVLAACGSPVAIPVVRDLYAFIEGCEDAGILGYTGSAAAPDDAIPALRNYADGLARTLTRYEEAIPILQTLPRDPRRDALLELAIRKVRFLSPVRKAETGADALPGVRKQQVELHSTLTMFVGDRVYTTSGGCSGFGYGPLMFYVLARDSLSLIEQVTVAPCDEEYQDVITSMHLVPGYVVLGLSYRFEESRPNVAVVDLKAMDVTGKKFIAADPMSLGQWNARLIRCATRPDELHTRFDPVTAELVKATDDEAIACLNGDVQYATGVVANFFPSAMPILTTPGYKAWKGRARHPFESYRFVSVADASTQVETPERKYVGMPLAIPGQDAVVLARMNPFKWTISRFDIAADEETTLLRLAAHRHGFPMIVWRHYLILGAGRDLIVYDLEKRSVIRYEKDLISEGNQPRCPGCTDRNRIGGFLLDRDRLYVMPENSENVRVIDLAVYHSSFSDGDFFFGTLD